MGPRDVEPLLMVVRRDCVARFRFLEQRFSGDLVRIIWDRRAAERRRAGGTVGQERRRADRRGPLPESWTGLDFVVVRPPVAPPPP